MTQRPTKVQTQYLAVMKQGHRAHINYQVVRQLHDAKDAVWMAPNTARALLKHGWIEWRPGNFVRRAGYYITDAGREVLPT